MPLNVMKKLCIVSFIILFSLNIPSGQEEDLPVGSPLDLTLPSQELFQDAFRETVPGVIWSEWSIHSFTKALALDKPVLLYINVDWDRRCYKMDTEIFSDPEVAYLINNLFVPVRVDGDKRPDIRNAYNVRIWPSIFFLMPNGDPIIWEKENGEAVPINLGFVRPDTMKTVGFRVYNYYKGERKKVLKLSSEFMASEANKLNIKPGSFGEDILANTVSALKGNFDLQHGGFGKEPKYPIPSAIEFALLFHSVEENAPLLEISAKSLKAIMGSKLYDGVDGGLFRLARKADWSDPMHEKLLDRNASVLSNLIDMYLASGEDIYKEYARSLIEYLDNNLLSESGAFYSGQLSDFGFWDGYYARTQEEKKLLSKPKVDNTILTNWNSITAAAYIKASLAFDDEALLEKARKSIDFLLNNLYVPGRGIFHSYEEGRGELIGVVEDQALFCLALINLYQATGEDHYLALAQDLSDFMIDNLQDRKGGGFYEFLRNEKAPGKLKLPLKSLEANAHVTRAMIRLYYLTGEKKYLRKATNTLQLFSERYIPYEVLASPYAVASLEFLHEPLKVLIVGDIDDPRTKELSKKGNQIPELWKVIKYIDIEEEDIGQIGIDPRVKPALYFIKESRISAPVSKVKRVLPAYRIFKKDLLSRDKD
jgi:uncharacterized protein YyaL (SSP411 family)